LGLGSGLRRSILAALAAVGVGCGADGSARADDGGWGEERAEVVVVNGRELPEAKAREIEALYGARPRPGRYWYDPVSGLYGVQGFPAFGFMYPGHDFGPLAADASAGDTGVHINGRELPRDEWALLSLILGGGIAPGRYWMLANGDAGAEGSFVPLVNLFAAARANAFSGAGGGGGEGGGDNFWTSRFSAGNHDGQGRGYVSVPGHGPVGYGFD